LGEIKPFIEEEKGDDGKPEVKFKEKNIYVEEFYVPLHLGYGPHLLLPYVQCHNWYFKFTIESTYNIGPIPPQNDQSTWLQRKKTPQKEKRPGDPVS
jgi:hypothetical protein